MRNAVEARFPKDKYHWLEFPRDHNYDTYDGLHVSQAEADRLAQALVRQVNQIAQYRNPPWSIPTEDRKSPAREGLNVLESLAA